MLNLYVILKKNSNIINNYYLNHYLIYFILQAFGTSAEALDYLLIRGIINWGKPVAEILSDGNLYIQEARSTEGSGLVSVLLEGPPNSGKTALAAQIAKNSDFPFVKVCTPEDMVGFTESAKCLSIRKVGMKLIFMYIFFIYNYNII